MNEIVFTQLLNILQRGMSQIRDAVKEIDFTTASTQAPSTPSYIVIAASGDLDNERVLTAGSNITLTDGGAGSTITIAASVTLDEAFGFFLS